MKSEEKIVEIVIFITDVFIKINRLSLGFPGRLQFFSTVKLIFFFRLRLKGLPFLGPLLTAVFGIVLTCEGA